MKALREHTEEQLKMAKLAGIHFPTILPLFRSPPNKMAIQSWVSRHEKIHPMLGQLAKNYGDNINYISFEQFLEQLMLTIIDFHKQSQGQPYVLFIPEDRESKLQSGCSDLWVPGLALEYAGLQWPEAILTTVNLTNYLLQHSEIKNVLVLDDGIFSGSHFRSQLGKAIARQNYRNAQKLAQTHFYIGVPFQTLNATKSIIERLSPQIVTILSHQKMKTLEDILEHDMRCFAEKMMGQSFRSMNTLTYFDHSMPDFLSTVTQLEKSHDEDPKKGYLADTVELMWLLGYAESPCEEISSKLIDYRAESTVEIIKDKGEWLAIINSQIIPGKRLIPVVIQPYRLHGKETLRDLKYALQLGTIGEYSGVDVPLHYEGVSEILKAFNIITPNKRPHKLNIQEQNYHSRSGFWNTGDMPHITKEVEGPGLTL